MVSSTLRLRFMNCLTSLHHPDLTTLQGGDGVKYSPITVHELLDVSSSSRLDNLTGGDGVKYSPITVHELLDVSSSSRLDNLTGGGDGVKYKDFYSSVCHVLTAHKRRKSGFDDDCRP